MNFCPETLFDRFGIFVSDLHGYADEIDVDVAHSTLKARNVPPSDWQWTWAAAKPLHYTDCPLYSPLTESGANHFSDLEPDIMCTQRNERDPFRVVIEILEDSDSLRDAAHAGGLVFDTQLNEAEAYSHKTRVRAYLPRILTAYDNLDTDARLTAALAAVRALQRLGFNMGTVAERLRTAGWELRDTGFVVRSPETREIFFPKGSPWDAFVLVRDIFAEANESITIVDPYCDTTIFQSLEERDLSGLRIQILCWRYADAVAAGATAFAAQYPGVTVDVRRTRDFHDRFIVLDGTSCIHVGASIKDAGNRASMISSIEDQRNREALLQQLRKSWESGTEVPAQRTRDQ